MTSISDPQAKSQVEPQEEANVALTDNNNYNVNVNSTDTIDITEDTKETTDEANDNTSSIKRDIILSLKGIPEYDQYPYTMAKEKFYFMASIKAPYFRAENRAPIDLVCVIDESGSMRGERIRLVRETVVFVVKNLEAQDRFACVGFDTNARTVIGLTKMDKKGREKALVAIQTIKARASTALCAGLVQGINILRNRQSTNTQAISSVMLFTDGQATDGPTTAIGIIAAMSDPNWSSITTKPIMTNKNTSVPVSTQPGNSMFQNFTNKLGWGSKSNTTPSVPVPQSQQRQMNVQGQVQQQIQIQGQMQQQMQVQQQMQGQQMLNQVQGQIPTIASASNNNSVPGQAQGQAPVGEESKVEEQAIIGESNENEITDNGLPCTVNTFGFGEGHNSTVLEAIADHGRGMYAYIRNADMIAETFAECLGGLVSVIGQNLQIKVEALNEVHINKCLSQGFPVRIPRVGKEIALTIADIQSEESRDLVFELSLPAINEELKAYPIVQFSVQYQNMITKKPQILSIVSTVSRVSGIDIGERNIELDLQYNRLIAAEALEKADKMAESGKLKEARMMLKQAQVTIQQSRSNANAYCVNLVNDINMCSEKLHSQQVYKNQGSHMMKMNKTAHYMQRSVQSAAWSSQQCYKNSSKSSMMRKFKK